MIARLTLFDQLYQHIGFNAPASTEMTSDQVELPDLAVAVVTLQN